MVKILKKKTKVKTKKLLKSEKKETTKNELIYQKSNVLKILTLLKPGLAVKDIVEGMKNFYFNGNFIVTYNDKISIMYPFKTDFTVFVNADTFYQLISKLPVEDFVMKQGKKDLFIKTKGINVKLPSIIDTEIIQRIKVVHKGLKKIEWKKLPDNFSSSISLCSFAAIQSETDSTLSCIKIEDDICVASDAKRIAYAKLDSKINPMFIKASEIKSLTQIKPTHYGEGKGWLYFKNEEGCVFSIRKIEGDFPEWKHFFDFKGVTLDLPNELFAGIDLASIFTEGGNKPYLSIHIENNICELIVKTESGKLKYSAPIKYKKEPIDFIINPDFLKEMMKFSTSITFAEGKSKLETDSFSVLTALYSKEDQDE